LSLRIANVNNKDIDYILYVDNNGTTWNDTTTIDVGSVNKDEGKNVVTRDTSFFMRDATGSIGIEIDDTDATITVWGVEYDIS